MKYEQLQYSFLDSINKPVYKKPMKLTVEEKKLLDEGVAVNTEYTIEKQEHEAPIEYVLTLLGEGVPSLIMQRVRSNIDVSGVLPHMNEPEQKRKMLSLELYLEQALINAILQSRYSVSDMLMGVAQTAEYEKEAVEHLETEGDGSLIFEFSKLEQSSEIVEEAYKLITEVCWLAEERLKALKIKGIN